MRSCCTFLSFYPLWFWGITYTECKAQIVRCNFDICIYLSSPSLAAITACHRPHDLKQRDWFSHRSGAWKSTIKVLADLVSLLPESPGKNSLPGLHLAAFSLCPQMASPWCVCAERDTERERQSERDREKERETERDGERQRQVEAERDRKRHRERQKERDTERKLSEISSYEDTDLVLTSFNPSYHPKALFPIQWHWGLWLHCMASGQHNSVHSDSHTTTARWRQEYFWSFDSLLDAPYVLVNIPPPKGNNLLTPIIVD